MNKEQELARKIILETNDNIFITGKAGTGKTTFLRQIVKELSAKRKKYVVLAPTGVAAINAKGSTIHRFFGWTAKDYPLTNNNVPIETYQKLNTIIIDEASMLRADLLDKIDSFLKNNIKNEEKENIPFAGVQMVFIGDLYQLPPVVKDEEKNKFTKSMIESDDEILDMLTDPSKHKKYDSCYFLSSYALRKKYLHIVEFTEVYRQHEEKFIDILNSVRVNTVSQEQLDILNKQIIKDTNINSQIKLVTTNEDAEKHNLQILDTLQSQLCTSFADAIPELDFKNKDDRYSYQTDKILNLKIGSKVMILINDKDSRYVNGSIGTIIGMTNTVGKFKYVRGKIKIKLDNERIVELEKYKWEKYKYVWNKKKEEYEQVLDGYFKQYPIKLAWAITIHKSQGQTFYTLTIDLGKGAFATGHVYVALSRSRTLEGISLTRKIEPRDVMTDPKIEKLLVLQNRINEILKE